MKALSPIRLLRVPRRGSHLSAWPSHCSLLSASSTTFFILLFRRNELLHASSQVLHPGARPWPTSTPLLPIIEFPSGLRPPQTGRPRSNSLTERAQSTVPAFTYSRKRASD